MAAAPAGDHSDLALHRRIGAVDENGVGVYLDLIAMGSRHPLQALTHNVNGLVD